MQSAPPLVSVSMLTYNHEKYIAEAIRSVLGQSFGDFELVIVDDGSTDATPRIIASFDDPRIVSIRQPNQGPSAAANRAYRACRGHYIALMSGDDVCHPDRLERQVSEYRRGGTRLLFSAVDLIDDDGRPLPHATTLHSLFNGRAPSRAQIYHRFFHHGNFINAITGFTETELLRTQGLCDPCLLQLQDFDQWIRLLKSYDICFLPQSTLRYRIRANGQNLSAASESQLARHTTELYFIMQRFFDGVRPEFFREAFRDEFLKPQCEHSLALRCEQAFLLTRSRFAVHQLVGIEKVRELLEDPEAAAVLRTDYQFDAPAFSRLLGESAIFNSATRSISTLYLDRQGDFTEEDACRVSVNLLQQQFDITFDLEGMPSVRKLRWDPFEGRTGQVHVEEILWQTADGRQGEVDVAALLSNAERHDDGVYTFNTTDPLFLIPFRGPVARVTLRGSWKVQSAEETHTRFLSLLRERDALRAELATRRADLASRNEQLHNILGSRRWRATEKVHSIWRVLRGRRSA